jgi:CelD/BcsL family acetyltransferase involved in cellulose biosynthesis
MSDPPVHAEVRSIRTVPPAPTRALRCEVVNDFRRLEELASEWTRLWSSDPRGEIFQTPEWAFAWWQLFGEGSTLCTLVVFAGNEIVGIVPLLKRDGIIQFLGVPEADYADIVCEESRGAEVLAVAFKTLRESVTGWRECVLQHLSTDSRVMRHYRSLPRSQRGGVHCVPAERYQTIVFDDEREAVFSALLGKNHTRRRRNKLQKAGQVRFRHLETQQEAKASLDDFFRHHVRRHAVIGRRSAYAAPQSRQFMKALLQTHGSAVRFGVLELDGRPLAWHFGFLVNGKFLLYQHTFDLDASDYTPGELILWNLFEYAKEHVTREFDFGKGDEPYKDRFANHSRETFSLFVEPAHPVGQIRGLGRTLQRGIQPSVQRVKQIVKSRRALLRGFRSLRMWTVATTARFREAKASGRVLSFGLDLGRALVHSFIWSQQSIVLFALEMPANSRTERVLRTEGSFHAEVTAASFGDLVDVAWQQPEMLSLNELARCRERLNEGDQAYIVRQDGRVVILSWVTNTPVPADAHFAQSPATKTNASAVTMDDCRSACRVDVSEAYRLLLSELVRAARSKNAELLVHCDSKQPALRMELERLGLVAKFQIKRYRFLSKLLRDSILLPPKSAAKLSPTA